MTVTINKEHRFTIERYLRIESNRIVSCMRVMKSRRNHDVDIIRHITSHVRISPLLPMHVWRARENLLFFRFFFVGQVFHHAGLWRLSAFAFLHDKMEHAQKGAVGTAGVRCYQ